MKLAVQRIVLTGNSTCGNLFIDDALECWTLELPRKDGLHGSCIQAGTYPITMGPSPKFEGSSDAWEREQGKCLPHVNNVPNRSEILIHWGNWPKDTEGCILVGNSHQTDAVGQSRIAFTDLMQKLLGESNITLEVLDPPLNGSSN